MLLTCFFKVSSSRDGWILNTAAIWNYLKAIKQNYHQNITKGQNACKFSSTQEEKGFHVNSPSAGTHIPNNIPNKRSQFEKGPGIYQTFAEHSSRAFSPKIRNQYPEVSKDKYQYLHYKQGHEGAKNEITCPKSQSKNDHSRFNLRSVRFQILYLP